VNGHVNGNKGVNGHVNGHADRIHLSVSTGGGGAGAQDGSGLRVAFQGAPGAYSEFAAKTALPGCDTVPCRTFADALAAVERGAADRAILPVESTMEGTALRNYDLLLRHGLVVAQEINLFVHYCLLAMPGVRAAEVRRVISHPMALAHCGRALARLGVDREPVEDTAGAVEMLRSNRMLDTAAIASPRAADLYGLDVLAHGLQDESWNVTRFLLLSRPPSPVALHVDADAKTSMVVAKSSMIRGEEGRRGGGAARIRAEARAGADLGRGVKQRAARRCEEGPARCCEEGSAWCGAARSGWRASRWGEGMAARKAEPRGAPGGARPVAPARTDGRGWADGRRPQTDPERKKEGGPTNLTPISTSWRR